MAFDIHQLDRIDGDDAQSACKEYESELVSLFLESPKGKALLKAFPRAGSWTLRFLQCGHRSLGATVPTMTEDDVDEIVTRLFPRKVSLQEPDEAREIMLELMAFWEFLNRTFHLPNADSILKFLRRIQADFPGIMKGPARFDPAKSLFMMGDTAEMDLADEGESHDGPADNENTRRMVQMLAYPAFDGPRPEGGTSGPGKAGVPGAAGKAGTDHRKT